MKDVKDFTEEEREAYNRGFYDGQDAGMRDLAEWNKEVQKVNEPNNKVYFELKKALKEDSEELHNESVALQANSSFEYGALIGALFVLNHLKKQ